MDRRTFLKSSGAAAAAVTTAGASAQAGETAGPVFLPGAKRFELRAAWPLDIPGLGTAAAQFIAQLDKVTDGHLQLHVPGPEGSTEYKGADTRRSWHIGFDADEAGLVPMFASLVGDLSWYKLDVWLRSAGGQVLWDEHAAEAGVKPLLVGHTTKGGGIWMRDPLPADARNLGRSEVAVDRFMGRVLQTLAAKIQTLAPQAAATALRRNHVTGAAGASAYADLALGFLPTDAHHYDLPGFDNGQPVVLTIPLLDWQQLTAGEQNLIEAVAARTASDNAAEHSAHIALARQAMRFQTPRYGGPLPALLQQRFAAGLKSTVHELAAENSDLRRVRDSVQGFLHATRDPDAPIA